MSSKTFTCVICGEEVSKRKSLSFKDGRACRHHEELQKALKEAEEEKLWKKAEENMRVISMAACVRSLHTLRGYPVELCYMRVREQMGKDMADKVRAAVEEQGGPKISQKEMQESIAAWGSLMVRVNKDERPSQS